MKAHTFHIPVMGIGFTIDTPLKVSHLGIDSAISLVDDILLEKLRKTYCTKFQIAYNEITESIEDFRAKRITSYLNLINNLAEKKFENLKNIANGYHGDLKQYINILPDTSVLKQQFQELMSNNFNVQEIKNWVEKNLTMGSIDVNIMTKVDKENYLHKEKLPSIYNDAHAALRGYANSDLCSSLILSAGMNPRLYSYIEQFEDFFPDVHGTIKKKIVLKVSDYRSALIQGKFLAKKGIWVSEYRIESGLNCGGHAFATDGYLLGPILAQFRDNREELIQSIHAILISALSAKERAVPQSVLDIKITAQGGVGNAGEHQFIQDYYEVDSIGWGTPFLLVPEATSVDNETLGKLVKAKEEDLYLSDISPLGVPFNSLKGNTKDIEKQVLINKGRPGSSCPKKYVALNKEFTEKGICTASRQYQHKKIIQLEKEDLSPEMYQKKYNKIIEKSCTCVGLGTAALLVNDIDTKVESNGVSICPGPNMAYYSKTMNLKEITDHIYGSSNVAREDRPNMFIKELTIYITYLKNMVKELDEIADKKQQKYMSVFAKNLQDGIMYYREVFSKATISFKESNELLLKDLNKEEQTLNQISREIAVL
ncbi:hypothetical protein [uncultured Aquimarina sp.]|uniref:hypothetical protein n=1 Tax=uncultured Aquimarina sp. TaxID=575652 RepID=UPI0026023C2D|nr:hypothetical protein [uncultured Aquimarina sp.]